MNLRILVAAGLAALFLSGCAGLPRATAPAAAAIPDGAARAREQDRQQAVRAVSEWGFSGRVAVSRGRDGGNARLDWQTAGQGYQVRLSAPVTGQGWELRVDPASGQARLDGLAGGPRSGDDPRTLVAGATGWDLPVDTLGDWVRGLVAPRARLLAEDAEGRPLRAEQDGWQVEFVQWHPAGEGRPALPRRIEAANGTSRVRLLVDEWSGW